MKKRTIGILATSVAVSALCVVTDVSAFARGVDAVGFTAGAVGSVGLTGAAVDLAAFTAGAVAFSVITKANINSARSQQLLNPKID
jgi:hypothetical protein